MREMTRLVSTIIFVITSFGCLASTETFSGSLNPNLNSLINIVTPAAPRVPTVFIPTIINNYFSAVKKLNLLRNAVTFTHGGKVDTDEDNIWFLGKKTVEYCVFKSPSFPLSSHELNDLVSDGLEKWKQFFIKYGFDKIEFEGLKNSTDGKISLSFKRVQNCLNPKKQLVLLFGDQKDLQKENFGGYVLGFSKRNEYSHDDYRTGGIVWISNGLTEKPRISHIVLHELGHVFGMKHDSVFVMDNFVASRLLSVDDPYFGNIESAHWKYSLKKGDTIEWSYNSSCHYKKGFMRGDKFPRALMKQFHLDRNKCYSFFTSFIRSRGMRNISIEFEIRPEIGASIKMKGKFTLSPHSKSQFSLGPGLFTYWKTFLGENNLQEKRKVLDTSKPFRLLQGHFSLQVGREEIQFPTIIKYKRGPVLTMYLSDDKKWWNGLFPIGLALE